MSVVDEYLRRSHIRDFFESPRDSTDGSYRLHDGIDTDFLRYEYRSSCEDIHSIEGSLELGLYMESIGWHTHIEGDTISSTLKIISSQACIRREAECMHRIDDYIFAKKSRCIFIVDIYHTDFSDFFTDTVFIEIFEEEELRLDIVVHGFMEIEMILRYVRHDSHIIAQTMDAVIVERVARCLHDEIGTPRFPRTSDELPQSEW